MPAKPKVRQKPVSESMNGRPRSRGTELVIITGMSGSGKASVMKAFEDLGFYCVDNLPAELMPPFVELVKQSPEIERAALVVDIREGNALDRLPRTLSEIKKELNTRILFLAGRTPSTRTLRFLPLSALNANGLTLFVTLPTKSSTHQNSTFTSCGNTFSISSRGARWRRPS